MSPITQCPECHTRFRVTDSQLAAHDGLVRCGHCHAVFNAADHLHSDQPSPQLSLPIEAPADFDRKLRKDVEPILNVPELEANPERPHTLAQQVQFVVEELTDELPEPLPLQRHAALKNMATALLTMLLLVQIIYSFRVDIAAQVPGLKPVLQQACAPFGCTVALPQKPDLITIESSALEADPKRANLITLHVLIHNQAGYTQAYPSLELTLTNQQDRALVRRLFHPADYLPADIDTHSQGVLAKRDLDIRLRLDTGELKPAGYRLFLFYPQ